VMISVL